VIDPFVAPEAGPPPPAVGELDVVRAVIDGLAAIPRNAAAFAGAGGVFVVAVVGVRIHWSLGLIVGPFLAWGWSRATLAAVDGRIRDVDVFDDPPARMYVRGGAVLLLRYVLLSPQALLLLLPEGRASAVAGMLLLLALPFAVCRLALGPWLVVDGNLGVAEAYAASWRGTRSAWPRLVALQGVCTILTVAALAVFAWLGTAGAWRALVVLACAVGVEALSSTMFAAAYRQLFGGSVSRAPAGRQG
jgi:hypothetical protein